MELMKTEKAAMTPQNFQDAQKFAAMVANTEFAPSGYRGKPEACLLAMVAGDEVGLKPMQSLQNIAVINGHPSIYGDAALALVKNSPDYEYLKETFDESTTTAKCVAKRKGEEEVVRTFSWEDATRADLATKKGPWTQYPKRMMQMRARSWAIRDCWPHVLKGLYVAEEAQDIPVERNVTPKKEESAPSENGIPAEKPAESGTTQRNYLMKLLNDAQRDGLVAEDEAKEVLTRYDRTKTPALKDKYLQKLEGRLEELGKQPQEEAQPEKKPEEELELF
jgi:hypothetical protein